MHLQTLAASAWVPPVLIVFFLAVGIVLVLTVLIQRPQGGGLSGAFGSGGGTGQSAFGAKTGDALTLATIAIFILYLCSAIALNYIIRPGDALPATEVLEPVPGETIPATDDAAETTSEDDTDQPAESPFDSESDPTDADPDSFPDTETP